MTAEVRCKCGKPFYAWHNPECKRHPPGWNGKRDCCEACREAIDAATPPQPGHPPCDPNFPSDDCTWPFRGCPFHDAEESSDDR